MPLPTAERIMWFRQSRPDALIDGCQSLRILALLVALAGQASAADDWEAPLAEVAAAVWQAAGGERRLAAKPVDRDATGLPAALTAALDAALAAALERAAPAGGRLLGPAAPREAAADVLLVCNAHLTRDGLVLAATLVSVGGGDTGRLLAAAPPVTLPWPSGSMTARSPPAAARVAGVALAEALRHDLDPAGRFRVSLRLGGERSSFGDWFLDQVGERLIERLAERPQYVSRPILHGEGDRRSLTVRLEAELWDRHDHVEANLRAVAGAVEAHAMIRLDAASLPGSLLPLTPAGGRLGDGYRIADGAAIAGPDLRRDELAAAAEVAARALLVEDALDLREGTPAVLRHRSEMAQAWRRLADAVPYDETWTGVATGPDAAARRLQARVAPIGGPQAPELSATLDHGLYREGEVPGARAIAVMVGGRVYLAAYVWGPDGGVTLIAPAEDVSSAVVAGGGSVRLTGPGEAAAPPSAGAPERLGAVVVVASALPFRPDRLAPPHGDGGEAAVTGGAFLAHLAALDRSRLRLAVLPYRVRRGG